VNAPVHGHVQQPTTAGANVYKRKREGWLRK
jgi:hypothetical protein